MFFNLYNRVNIATVRHNNDITHGAVITFLLSLMVRADDDFIYSPVPHTLNITSWRHSQIMLSDPLIYSGSQNCCP